MAGTAIPAAPPLPGAAKTTTAAPASRAKPAAAKPAPSKEEVAGRPPSGKSPGKTATKVPPGTRKSGNGTTAKAAPQPPRERPATRIVGSEPGQADERARRAVAGRRLDASDADPRESPELAKMRDLDQLLFPLKKGGVAGPWPAEVEVGGVPPRVEATGLPNAAPIGGEATAVPRPELAWATALEKPDFPVRLDASVVRYLTYYKENPKGRNLLAGWIRKSGRYGAPVRKLLRDRGLPQDLMWLALVESGFDPTIHSHAGAAGLWQFVPSTARIYGLTVTRRVDERLDPERSTVAALNHLEDLHTRFGSWELAFAAYNMGYGGLLAAIRKFNTNDYWELRRLEAGLPYETALYVPKIASIAIAARNCKVFGCDKIELDDPEPFGEQGVEAAIVAPGVTLEEVAEAVGVRVAHLAALNPHLLGSRLPPIDHTLDGRRGWTVHVPRGRGALARSLAPKENPPHQLSTYTVRWGEPTEHVAARHGTTAGHLEQLNELEPGESARAGTVLFVPTRTRPRSDIDAAAEVAGAHGIGKSGRPLFVVPGHDFYQPGRRRVFYQPVLGDTLEDVAESCNVSVGDLRRWNHLDGRTALQEGMTLQIFVPKDAHPRNVLLIEAEQVETVAIASKPFFEHFVGTMGRERLEVVAQAGDTFSSIAGKHGMSVNMLERVNQRSRKSKLAPGEKIVVYAKRQAPAISRPAPVKSQPLDDDTLDGDEEGDRANRGTDDAAEPRAPKASETAARPEARRDATPAKTEETAASDLPPTKTDDPAAATQPPAGPIAPAPIAVPETPTSPGG
ncbi:MAG: transglycosylase SLT domain-containing protein [Deltaproteobacteria bacterium]|nr:transglycosylase SLT domain-containing protein [Deltaproteobacteria bacterium]